MRAKVHVHEHYVVTVEEYAKDIRHISWTERAPWWINMFPFFTVWIICDASVRLRKKLPQEGTICHCDGASHKVRLAHIPVVLQLTSTPLWKSCGFGKTTLFRSIVLPLMNTTHIVVIALQLPLKAITGPVVTPSRRPVKISVWAAAGMTVNLCSCPNSFQKQLSGTTLNRWTNTADNQGWKPNDSSWQSSEPTRWWWATSTGNLGQNWGCAGTWSQHHFSCIVTKMNYKQNSVQVWEYYYTSLILPVCSESWNTVVGLPPEGASMQMACRLEQ